MTDMTTPLVMGDIVTFAPLILASLSIVFLILNSKERAAVSKVISTATSILIIIGSLYSLERVVSWFPQILESAEDFFFEPFNVIVYTFFEIPHALLLFFLSWISFRKSNIFGKVLAAFGLIASSTFILLWILFWIRLFF